MLSIIKKMYCRARCPEDDEDCANRCDKLLSFMETTYKEEKAAHSQYEASERRHWTIQNVAQPVIAVAATFTLGAAVFAACYTKRQWDTARDTERRQLRAYVMCNKAELVSYAGGGIHGEDVWQIRVMMKNTGVTPTRHLIKRSVVAYGTMRGWELQDKPIWNSDSPGQLMGSVGPQDESMANGYATGASDIMALVNSSRSLQMAGMITYEDIFGDAHRTEYCFAIWPPSFVRSDYKVGQIIPFETRLCPKHNCTDDECKTEN